MYKMNVLIDFTKTLGNFWVYCKTINAVKIVFGFLDSIKYKLCIYMYITAPLLVDTSLVPQSCQIQYHAKNTTKKIKKNMRTAKIFIINHRFEVTV